MAKAVRTVKRALLIAIAIAIAFGACVRDVELSRPPPPDAIFEGPDGGGTPDAQPFIPPDA